MSSYDDTSKFGVPDSQRECNPRETLGSADEGTQESAKRARVIITSYRARLIEDKDNLYGGAKSLLDSIKYSGLIRDDSEKEIDYDVYQFKVAHRKEEHTTVDIIYADN